MSSFSSKDRDVQRSPTPTGPTPIQTRQESFPRYDAAKDPIAPARAQPHYNMDGESPQPRVQRERAPSRPMSMVQTYQPPLMDVNQDTLPELQPIFTFLNSHANKLYQEGYFLKLDDQNTHGRPNADRTWTECFAQLVGTVLSLWDAAELDAAGQDGEVLPKFINLTDASIKMITSLPTRSDSEAPLQNVLSISTAGKNRYLLHFNSHHSLIQWTAGIRLAMFEHATLQEAYTGALIAGKGKALNNINTIMDRAKMPTADWARVRFGAGTPWRRCWCVITPPDEKEVQKLQKQMNKKKSAYDRSRPPMLKGDIKFYDSKKTKKMKPIATISDAYSAFAIYPQSKPLIDASTLVKVEGSIVIHSNPPTTSEGFVFVMPEVHPAVTGFEMMLRWLFPVFDTFGLYGRPGRLVADIKDTRSLMFAMPKHRRYGYLEILDVSGLILEQGSENWKEGEWRKRMKELTGKRMAAIESGSQRNSRYSSRRSTRNSFGPSRSRVQFDDGASVRSSPSITWGNTQDPSAGGFPRTDSAPAAAAMFTPPKGQPLTHQRSVSEAHGLDRYQQNSSGYDGAYDVTPPPPPPHAIGVASGREGSSLRYRSDMPPTPERLSSEDEQVARGTPVRELQDLQAVTSPEPVAAPPAFAHAPGSMPISKPYHSPELRRANSRMSSTTLDQLAGAGGYRAMGGDFRAEEDQRWHDRSQYSEESGQRGVLSDANTNEYSANDRLNQGLVAESKQRFSFEQPSPISPPTNEPTNYSQPPPQFSYDSSHNLPSTSQVDISPPGSPRGQPSNNRTYEPPQVYASQETTSPPYRHAPQSSVGSLHSIASQPRLQTNPSVVARKPLPARNPAIETPISAETASSSGSLRRHIIDETAFDMIGNDDRGLTPLPDAPLYRQNSGVSSIYEDSASTTSPDYASTRRSMDTQKSVEKPRAGVMKTVGQLEKTPSNESREKASSFDIDFGPTLNLASDRPVRSQSPGPAQGLARGPSPGPGMHNFTTDRAPRQHSPGRGLESPSRNVVTPENAHYRNNSSESRTVAWQPGMAMNQNVGQAITPEQFVQQRATMATATPMYAHQRQQSGNTLRANTPTPPLPRNRSTDYLAQKGHSRNNSADLLQRPSSRGASVALGPSGSGDIASTLSAREQEHIARVTGQPLINMAQNANRQAPGAGLVGAIEAREKEKQQMKQGINSQAVQQAITQRQQQAIAQQQQQQQALYQQQYADQMSQAQYGTMGQYPQNFAAQAQRQQSWVSPAANVYAQGGGFSTPPTAWTASPDGRQSPSQYSPRQQQYFPPQQGQGQGRGNTGFHGHGY